MTIPPYYPYYIPKNLLTIEPSRFVLIPPTPTIIFFKLYQPGVTGLSLRRSGTQIRPSTKTEYTQAVQHLIEIIGDIDFQAVCLASIIISFQRQLFLPFHNDSTSIN
jgi:hypothetical protein